MEGERGKLMGKQLLRRFDFSLENLTRPWSSVSAGIFIQKGMWVRVTRREGV